MDEKKKLSDEELENVNGGYNFDETLDSFCDIIGDGTNVTNSTILIRTTFET